MYRHRLGSIATLSSQGQPQILHSVQDDSSFFDVDFSDGILATTYYDNGKRTVNFVVPGTDSTSTVPPNFWVTMR